MATTPTNQSITLTCPSFGAANLESWNQKVVIHPDNDDSALGNPLKTRGEYIAITLYCSGCNNNCYIATGNHKGQQEFGIFPGTPAHPESFVDIKAAKCVGVEVLC